MNGQVVAGIGKHGSNDEVLILLHRALYGRDGKNTTRKVRACALHTNTQTCRQAGKPSIRFAM